ncbi:MauE/DoxX family redox-associated membrane protein [Tumebacillus lipolyticus]|uniref:MauE/DoxX family redox-associated membrane protein n=1 Tax=Tumebacillus lipolyticus TaxID=1280370 RepID=A0ABW4ZUB1_9BACL
MEEIAFYGSVVIGMIFMSTGWSNFKKLEEHTGIIMAYKILPSRMASVFAKVDVWFQLLVSVLLLLGLFRQAALGIVTVLLLLYATAISVNMWRGRREISCGCGGVMGDHHLSWSLVVRNVLLAFVSGWLITVPVSLGCLDAVLAGAEWSEVLSIQVLQLHLVALLTLMTCTTAMKLYEVWRRMDEMNKGMLEMVRRG